MSLEIILKHDPDGEENTFVFGDAKIPTGTLDITENGRYDVTDKAAVNVAVPQGVFPEGTLNITENGDYDVTQKAGVHVDVPGLVPTGTLNVNENGTFDVTDKAEVVVNVPQGVFPSGTLDVTSNGTYDVTEKASVDVNVPGLVPTGIIDITKNGAYIVDRYEAANVNVPQGDTRPPIVFNSGWFKGRTNGIGNRVRNESLMNDKVTEGYNIQIYLVSISDVYKKDVLDQLKNNVPTIRIHSVSGETMEFGELHYIYNVSSGTFSFGPPYQCPTEVETTGTDCFFAIPPNFFTASTASGNFRFYNESISSKYTGDVMIEIIPNENQADNEGIWALMIYAPNCVDLRIGRLSTVQYGIGWVDVIGRTKQTDFSNFLRNMSNFVGGSFDLTDATNVTDFLTNTVPATNGLTIYGYPVKQIDPLSPEPPPTEDEGGGGIEPPPPED